MPPLSAEDHARARAEGRDRVRSIMTCPEARDRPKAAMALAERGEITLEEARTELRKAAPETFDLAVAMRAKVEASAAAKRGATSASAASIGGFNLSANMRDRFGGSR